MTTQYYNHYRHLETRQGLSVGLLEHELLLVWAGIHLLQIHFTRLLLLLIYIAIKLTFARKVSVIGPWGKSGTHSCIFRAVTVVTSCR